MTLSPFLSTARLSLSLSTSHVFYAMLTPQVAHDCLAAGATEAVVFPTDLASEAVGHSVHLSSSLRLSLSVSPSLSPSLLLSSSSVSPSPSLSLSSKQPVFMLV